MPRSLSSVLHVPDFRKTCSSDTEHLQNSAYAHCIVKVVLQGTDGKHDSVRNEGFERYTHRGNGTEILSDHQFQSIEFQEM